MIRRGFRWITAAAAAWTMALVAPAGQQPPVFRSGVDVVSVDALVVTDEGRPIEGLGPDDFVLTVDGKPRAVVSAQFVGASDASEKTTPAAPRSLPDFSTNDLSATGRIVLLVVDRTNIRQGEGRHAMAGVARLVEELSPGDRIGLFTFPSGGPQVEITSDRQAVIEALKTIRGVEERQSDPTISVTISEALRIDRMNPQAIPLDIIERNCMGLGFDSTRYLQACRSRIVSAAKIRVQETRQRNEDTLARLNALLESVRYVEGPKTVVFVSEGLPFDNQGRGGLRQFGSAVAASGTSFYAVQIFVPPADAATMRVQPDWDEDRRLRADGLSLVTAVSGGAFFRPPSGLEPTFGRIARELSARYVLGFQVAPQERDGKAHQIQVRLKQSGSRIIRHRTEFTADTKPGVLVRRVETLSGALNEPLPIAGLPLRIATYVVPDKPAAFKVLLDAEIGNAGSAAVPTQVMFEVIDAQRRRVGEGEETLGSTSGAQSTPLRFTTAVALPAGRYRVKLAAKEKDGRLGSVEHHFIIEPPDARDLTVGSLMLFRAVDAGVSARPELLFDLSQREPGFGAHLIIRGGSRTPDDVNAVLEVTDATGLTRFNRTMTVAEGTPPGQRAFELQIPTRGWSEGSYTAQVTLLQAGQPLTKIKRALAIRPAPAEPVTTASGPGATKETKDSPARAAAARDDEVAQVVARASRYVADYAERATSVVAEERYVQAIMEEIAGNSPSPPDQVLAWREQGARNLSAGVLRRRQLLSDLLMVKTSTGWYTNYRDVAEVDGEPIKNRAKRALDLFTSGGSGADVGATLKQIADEGTRYNLGTLRRTVNVPTLALFTLHPKHVARFTFEAAGTETIDGTPVLVLSFRERQRPTFVMTAEGDEVFTSGRLWVAAESGHVLRTELAFDQAAAQRRVRLDVHYARVEVVDLLMPSRMRERYVPLSPSRNGRTQVITGEARYTNFRVFSVQTNEHRE